MGVVVVEWDQLVLIATFSEITRILAFCFFNCCCCCASTWPTCPYWHLFGNILALFFQFFHCCCCYYCLTILLLSSSFCRYHCGFWKQMKDESCCCSATATNLSHFQKLLLPKTYHRAITSLLFPSMHIVPLYNHISPPTNPVTRVPFLPLPLVHWQIWMSLIYLSHVFKKYYINLIPNTLRSE